MVIPVVGESEWKNTLQGVPIWQPGSAPMVVVVPHPDDETLAAGGLIAMQRALGVDVTIVAVTDGENAYAENAGLGELRMKEHTAAVERLGVAAEKMVRLGLVDSAVTKQEAALTEALRGLVQAETVVVAPWVGDFHPDHEACARAAATVAREKGATQVGYFFWTWHRGTPAQLLEGLRTESLTLHRFALSEAAMRAKAEALACHRSQLEHVSGEPILPENLLWPARMGFEVFAL